VTVTLFGRMVLQKPYLSVQHIRNRKKLRAANLKMENLYFLDESLFQTYANIARFVRRPCNSKYFRKHVRTMDREVHR